jgi:hypothetical protein
MEQIYLLVVDMNQSYVTYLRIGQGLARGLKGNRSFLLYNDLFLIE